MHCEFNKVAFHEFQIVFRFDEYCNKSRRTTALDYIRLCGHLNYLKATGFRFRRKDRVETLQNTHKGYWLEVAVLLV